MTWYHSFSSFEYIIIGVFIALYLLYIVREARAARRLQTGYAGLVFKLVLRSVYLSLIIMALLGPAFGNMKKEVKAVGKDIYVAIDLSESMNATDISPTRLQRVKFEMKNLVKAFSSDRIGLIIFSSQAFVQCPLTFDQGALNLFIETLSTNLVPNTGTDFGPPLRLASERIMEKQGENVDDNAKVILLISDGEDFGKETDEAVRIMDEQGIRLFTLGIGTEDGSRIPEGNGYKRDRNGEVVTTKLNPSSLKTLADKTDGEYFEISADRNDSKRLIYAIDQIKGKVRDVKEIDVSTNKYQLLLLAALLLMLVDLLIQVKVIRI